MKNLTDEIEVISAIFKKLEGTTAAMLTIAAMLSRISANLKKINTTLGTKLDILDATMQEGIENIDENLQVIGIAIDGVKEEVSGIKCEIPIIHSAVYQVAQNLSEK